MDILSLVQHLKDLGILARQDLSWFKHIRSTCDKARQKACWVLISVFFIRSPAVIKALASARHEALKYGKNDCVSGER